MNDPAALRAEAAELRKLCGEAHRHGDELAALSRVQDADETVDRRIGQANWEASIRAHGLGNAYGQRALILEGQAERIEAANPPPPQT